MMIAKGMIGITIVAIALMFYQSYKMDKTFISIDRIVEEMQRCGRVSLMSQRDDVLQTMGQPVKTEVVPSIVGGLADRLYYHYQTVKTDHDPYVDVDQRLNKVVAYDCAFSRHDLKTVKAGQVRMPKDQALPTDPKRY